MTRNNKDLQKVAMLKNMWLINRFNWRLAKKNCRASVSVRGVLRKIHVPLVSTIALTMYFLGCEATPPDISSRPSKVAVSPTASPTTGAVQVPPLLISPDLSSEPCAVVALEGATATLDRVSSDVLRLQIRDTGGRMIGDAPAAVLSLEAEKQISSPPDVAFFPFTSRDLVAKLPHSVNSPTSAALRLLSFNEFSVQERQVVLRCPETIPTALTSVEDFLTSPAVHARRLRQFISVLENAVADAPEKAGTVVAFMLHSAQDSARVADAEVQSILAEIVQLLRAARS
ncbi:MAG: hypothetical protein N2Z21_10130 [Candidatus Sumerlaeaceae bacterium]|nr:hypothetical protein [Candidatus Sumerlaeaceae bacterium]